LAERPVRDALAVREAAPGAKDRPCRAVAEPLPQLSDERRLPDAGVAHDRDGARFAAGDDAFVLLLKLAQLVPAADEDRLEAADATGTHERERAHEPAAGDALRFALRLDRRRLGELERAADSGDGPLPDEDLARRGSLLEARAHVDCIAGHEGASLAWTADDHVTGIHADPEGEALSEQLRQPPLHRDGDV